MAFGEDFGYLKDEENNRLGAITKRALLLGSILFSIACFVYITVTAYYFAYGDQSSNIKVIKSPPQPIKVLIEEDDETNAVKDIDKTIYDNIVGNKNLAKENLNDVRIIDQASTPVVRDSVRTSTAKAMLANNQLQNEVVEVSDPSRKTVIKQAGEQTKKTKIDNSQFMVFDAASGQNKAVDNSFNAPKKDISKEVSKDIFKEQNAQTKPAINNKANDKGLARVQLAALSSKNGAVDYWSRIKKNYPNLFVGLDYFISEVKIGSKGTFYRLQIGNFRSQIEAENFCRKFIASSGKSKADCIIVE